MTLAVLSTPRTSCPLMRIHLGMRRLCIQSSSLIERCLIRHARVAGSIASRANRRRRIRVHMQMVGGKSYTYLWTYARKRRY